MLTATLEADSMPRVNRWGDFELLEEIGQGSFGTVYRANHPTLRQEVALKLVPVPSGGAREIEKALEEPRRLASVRHQHVVVVHDARHIDGYVGICMELVRGESLAELVKRRGPFGAEETIACAANLCRALSAIHRASIVHNDVKAQNVMRENGGRIVLMDFGAGRRLIDPDATTAMYLAGTPAYMAPELFQLQSPSPASDIYSLGVLLFYLLTGGYPVKAQSMEQFAAAHGRRERHYLGDVRDDIPERLLTVVDRALEHSLADRYHSAGEMLSDLSDRDARLSKRRTRTPGSTPPPPRDRPSTKRSLKTVRLRDASLSGARRWAGEWIWPAAAITTAAVLVIWFLGFMASKAYNDMFGVIDEFAGDSPLTWLEVGFQTLPLPVFYMVAVITVCVVVAFLWHIVTRLLPVLETWSVRTSRQFETAGARAGITDDGSLPTAVLLLQAVSLGVTVWTFSELLEAFSTSIASGPIEQHARLARNNEPEWLLYCGVAAVLTLASGVAWAAIIRRRPPGRGVATIAAGIVMTGVFAAMFAVPWRIYQESWFETVTFDSKQCFIIAERGGRLLLVCPSNANAPNPIVDAQDPKLHRPSSSQPRNIFDAVATERRLQGAK